MEEQNMNNQNNDPFADMVNDVEFNDYIGSDKNSFNIDSFEYEKIVSQRESLREKLKDRTNKIRMFTVIIVSLITNDIKLEKELTPGLSRYALLYSNIRELYTVLKEDHQDLDEEWKRINIIAKAFYLLEESFENPKLTPEMDLEIQNKNLKTIDKNKRIFKDILIKTFENLIEKSDVMLIITWARKCYYHIHCFQPPIRYDPMIALKDSIGETDHFEELISSILEKFPHFIEDTN